MTDFVKEQKIMVSDIEMESQRSAVITMHLQTREVHTKLIDKIAALEGIIFAEEVQ